MDLLLISIGPVAVIAVYIWLRDKYEREPLRLLLLALFAGTLIVVPVMFVEGLISSAGDRFNGFTAAAWNAFAVAAVTEEGFKYLALFLLIWKSPEFNDKYDGIVYATFISLGFAGIENILYVLKGGYATGMIRAVTAVPAHAVFGITMGFYFGMAKFYLTRRMAFKLRALLIPILLHGIYNFILMTGISWLWIVFAGFILFLYLSGLRRMKQLSDHSYFRTDYDLLNEKFGNGNRNS